MMAPIITAYPKRRDQKLSYLVTQRPPIHTTILVLRAYLPPLGFLDLRSARLHLVMMIRILKANPTFLPGAYV